MKKIVIFIGFVILFGGIYIIFFTPNSAIAPEAQYDTVSTTDSSDIEIIAENLEVPWDMVFLPDDSLLVTERTGNLVRILDGSRQEIPRAVAARGEGGLLGLTLHPDFAENNFVYLYETREVEGGLMNRVARYRFNTETNTLSDEWVVIDNIPGARYHDGGRMQFGPATSCESGQADCMLYITTGDAGDKDSAQDRNSLAGKILRVRDDGSIPDDNPFRNAVYSYGHRNPQGLAWDSEGRLWSTEHGRSGIRSGYDELNLIEIGGNYGWPTVQGDETRAEMISPVLHSGANETWAPASLVHIDGQLYWGGLRGESLYRVDIVDNEVANFTQFFENEYGRIRTVVLKPNKTHLYLLTSNTDGRGRPRNQDDIILSVPLINLK